MSLKRLFPIAAVLLLAVAAPSALAADSVTVGTVTATSSNVTVPVYIRDAGGTPLGMDQPAGSRIQSFSIKVTYAPAAAVQSITFTRAGITANLAPTFESSPSSAGSVSLLATFQESTAPLPFTLNAAAPGNQVAKLTVTLSSSATPGTPITLTVDTSLTQLTNSGGTTKETVANGGLSVTNGAINIPQASLASVTPSSRNVPLGGSATFAVNLSAAAFANTTVSLTSSAPSTLRVPASVIVPAGSSNVQFNANGLALGSATITATLGSATATANATVVNVPVTCGTPTAPPLTAPASVGSNEQYTVAWDVVGNANEYVIEESADSGFATSTPQTLTATSATFQHEGPGTYYYRVRAHNHTASCDVFSSYSSTVTVQVTAAPPPPVPPSSFVAVVGSLPGAFNAQFRTSVQLYNPKSDPISGKLVFHPANVSGSAADPSMPFTLGPGKTLAYADVLPAMGVPSGIGSLDVIGEVGSSLPLVLARVFNDAGASGTTGLAEESQRAEDALQTGHSGVLLAPADAQKFRMNIGIRTLTNGVTMNITVRDKDGNVVKTTSKSYGPTFFTQPSAAQLLDGYTLAGGETMTFDIQSGSAFIYGSTTDNTTNDPSVQLAKSTD